MTGGLVYAQGQAFTGGAGTVVVEQAGANGVALAELLDFRLIGGSGGEVITAGSSTLLDEFYISHAAGGIARREVALEDIDRFYDNSGNFYLEDPQTITLILGDGRCAEVTLFGTDSLAEVEAKLNEAIHLGLGQQTYTAGLYDPSAFNAERSGVPAYVRYIAPGESDPTGLFSVEGKSRKVI